MPQLPIISAVSLQPIAGNSQATASVASPAEDGGGLESAPGLNFGAVLTRQLKGIAELLEQKEGAGLALAAVDEIAESTVDAGAAVFPIDLSTLNASLLVSTSSVQAGVGIAASAEKPLLRRDGSEGGVDASSMSSANSLTQLLVSPVQVGVGVVVSEGRSFLRRDGSEGGEDSSNISSRVGAENLLTQLRRDGSEGGVDGSRILSGVGEENLLMELPQGGGTRLAAEIAANGKNLPQVASPEELFADKLAALAKVSIVDAGEEFQSVDLFATANPPATTAVAAFRNPELLPLPALPVAPRVGSAEWGGAVGEKVVWMANQSHQVAELHLNPPNLGPIEVRLTISNDQASALFVSHHSAVREAIETALPRLREMLADNGITLGNVSVGAESFSQQQAPDQRSGKEGGRSGLGVESVMAQMVMSGRPSGVTHDGMVDIFA